MDLAQRTLMTELEELKFDQDARAFVARIYEAYHYDFRNYAMTSVKRRIRAALARFGLPDVASLEARLDEDASFFSKLLQFMTVSTSEMFRDPPFFKVVREKAAPSLITYPSLKFWIAGSSAGEEVYSYAILLEEEGLLDRSTIYATDINPVSLKRAEEGVFALDRAKLFALNYQKSGGKRSLMDYCATDRSSILFHKRLKKNIVFADHSLATDSVFSEMHFISCRNVLIYFDRVCKNEHSAFLESLWRATDFWGLGSKSRFALQTKSVFLSRSLPWRSFIDDSKQKRIIVIGASAGGVEALKRILPSVEPRLSWAIAIVVHVSADLTTDLSRLFKDICGVNAKEAEDKEPIEAGAVYFAPAGYHLQAEFDASWSLSVDEPVHYARPSIDVLFESAAAAFGHRATAILLTGANSDGATGIASIVAHGGRAIVQRPETAAFSAMPRAAMAAAPSAKALSLDEIALFLGELARE